MTGNDLKVEENMERDLLKYILNNKYFSNVHMKTKNMNLKVLMSRM